MGTVISSPWDWDWSRSWNGCQAAGLSLGVGLGRVARGVTGRKGAQRHTPFAAALTLAFVLVLSFVSVLMLWASGLIRGRGSRKKHVLNVTQPLNQIARTLTVRILSMLGADPKERCWAHLDDSSP